MGASDQFALYAFLNLAGTTNFLLASRLEDEGIARGSVTRGGISAPALAARRIALAAIVPRLARAGRLRRAGRGRGAGAAMSW